MRRLAFVGATAALLVLMALPAQAKITGEATISGPGLPGGGSITLDGDGSPRSGWAAFSVLLIDARVGRDSPPTSDLGTRYEVVLDIQFPRQEEDIVQHLYPYAKGGALLYTRPGQELLDLRAPSGWWRVDDALMDLLEGAGLPEKAPIVDQPVRPNPTVSAPAEGVSPVVWAIAGLAGLLVIGAATARRKARMAPAAE